MKSGIDRAVAPSARLAESRSCSVASPISQAHRLWLHLTALVLVPVTALVAFSTIVGLDRRTTAHAAAVTKERIDYLGDLLELRWLLTNERIPSQSTMAASEMGVALPLIKLMLGFDPNAATERARADLDRFLTTFHPPRDAQVRRTIAVLRRAVDRPSTLTSTELASRYSALDVSFQGPIDVELRRIVSLNALAGGGIVVTQRMNALSEAVELNRASEAQTLALFESAGEHRATALRNLISATDRMRRTKARLQAGAGTETINALRAIDSDAATLQMADDVESTISAKRSAIGKQGLMTSASTFRASFQRARLLSDLFRAASSDASQAAERAGARVYRSFVLALSIATSTVILSLAAAYLVSRTIRRPLEALSNRARAIVAGDLSKDPLPERGPREVAVVTRALNELTTNLVVMEAQATVLAGGDLNSSILNNPVAGPLGSSIQASVRRLSDAMRDQEELELALRHQARHDDLTGLPNRAAANDMLDRAVARLRRAPLADLNSALGVSFLDLDGFKSINDTYGHPEGDEVLRIVGKRLRSTVRADEFVARLGGDEFIIISDQLTDPDSLSQLGARVQSMISAPITVGKRSHEVGVSIGAVWTADRTVTPSALLHASDVAVYRAKQEGRRRVVVDELRPDVTPLTQLA